MSYSTSSKHICSDCFGTGLYSWCSDIGWEGFGVTVKTFLVNLTLFGLSPGICHSCVCLYKMNV